MELTLSKQEKYKQIRYSLKKHRERKKQSYSLSYGVAILPECKFARVSNATIPKYLDVDLETLKVIVPFPTIT